MEGFDRLFENSDVEEEFRSCCEDEEWQDTEEYLAEGSNEDPDDFSSEEDEYVDDFSLRMFFKGVSVTEDAGLGSRASGIGVVMERSPGVPIFKVQKKLDFFVDEVVAEHLALMDGLLEAQRNGIRRVYAFTDSKEVYRQIAETEPHEDQLLVALGLRILEHANNLEAFVLKLVPRSVIERPLRLAQEAIGIVNSLKLERIYCPFPDCSVLLSPAQCSSSRASSSNQIDNDCIECSECHRLVCASCGVHWHSSMTCEEYQNLAAEERDAGGITLHRLAQDNNWRRCQQCRHIIELTEGCQHMTCLCGHEFCYSCGAEYRDGVQTCQCAFWDEEDNFELSSVQSNQQTEQWRWEPFDPLPSVTDGYSEQERAQLALIQRFLAGGFGFSDDQHHNYQCQSPPRCSDSYLDTIKDLHQLPWLERFVSVISDSYHEEYIQ